MTTSFLAIIPSQDGSKRLKDKNLCKINGKTLVEHSIDFIKRSKYVDRIIVSTNSDSVKEICADYEVEVMDRPTCMCGDTDVVDVYKFVVQKQLKDPPPTEQIYIIGVQPDNPDRTIELDDMIDYCLENNYDDCITVGTDGHRNGSVRIMDYFSLFNGKVGSAKVGVTIDKCTNIHVKQDFNMARHHMSEKIIEIPGLINHYQIGGKRTFVIAEAACNHLCSLEMAKQMIMEAKIAGADAIKFQTYRANTHVTKDAVSYWGNKPMKQIDYYKMLDKFGKKEYSLLFEYAYDIGILSFSTPFDVDSARMLNGIGMELYKIPSMAINDLNLLKVIAGFQKPIILSTGGSTLKEIDRAIQVIFDEDNYKLVLLACNLSYPTADKNANLKRIETLMERYPYFVIGYSDHTYPDKNMIIPSLAVAMGAKVIEKHYALDKTAIGSGQFFSSDSNDFKKMIENIRLCETVMGSKDVLVNDSEKGAVEGSRKSIIVNTTKILSGTILESDMLIGKRPGTGIPIDQIQSVLGRKTNKDLYEDEMLKWENLD